MQLSYWQKRKLYIPVQFHFKMKKSRVLLLVLLFLILTSLIYFFSINSPQLTGNTVYTPPAYFNCSNDSIRATWDSIFKEPSTNLNIFVNESDKCNLMQAYKNKSNQFFVLTYLDLMWGPYLKQTILMAFKSNVTDSQAAAIVNTPSLSGDFALSSVGFDSPYNYYINITPINSLPAADLEFRSVFKVIPSAFTTYSGLYGDSMYSFLENSTDNQSILISRGLVSANYSLTFFSHIIFNMTNCSANWAPVNTTCNQTTNTLTAWFNDTNNCKFYFQQNNYTAPTNETLACVVSTSRLHGTSDSISKANLFNLSLYINDSLLNSTHAYEESLPLKFKENSSTLVSLIYNFSQGLNLSNIRIEKQNSSFKFGYLIISGLDASKTAYLDRLNLSSSAVCVKDASISSISEVSNFCNSSSEFLVPYPGSNSDYSCAVSGSGFAVSGLLHSAVREISQNSSLPQEACITNWNCTQWSACMNGNQIRTCVDTNYCSNYTSQPAEVQSCVPACISDWVCGNWSACAENGNQTRTCTDSNNCAVPDGLPAESQPCDEASKKSSSIIPYLIMGFIIFVILAILVALVAYLVKSNERNDFSSSPSSKLGPVTPPGPQNAPSTPGMPGAGQVISSNLSSQNSRNQ